MLRLKEADKATKGSSIAQDSEIIVEGNRVTLSGIYHIAGKFGPYIPLGEASVYLVDDQTILAGLRRQTRRGFGQAALGACGRFNI